MIKAELNGIKTLKKFYTEIRKQQEAAHGDDYCEQHDAIQKYLKECESYKELGTHQGGTAAAALLMKPKKIELVDISMENYRKFAKSIFEDYCNKNNIELSVLEVDSSSKQSVTNEYDMLLIDSYHKRNHMEKELAIHHNKIKKYIVFHDTNSIKELQNCIEDFCNNNKQWVIIEQGKSNVGYTVIKKIK